MSKTPACTETADLTLEAKMMAGMLHSNAHQQQHTAKTVTEIANIIGPLPMLGSLKVLPETTVDAGC